MRKQYRLPALIGLSLALGVGLGLWKASTGELISNIGFILVGTSIGVVAALWVVQDALDRREANHRLKLKSRLLEYGGDASVSVIERLFGPSVVFDGERLIIAWQRIRQGKLDATGLREALHEQVQARLFTPEERKSHVMPNPRTALRNERDDFEICALGVDRILNRWYAHFDLFEPDEPPIAFLETAAMHLANGQRRGSLDTFEAISLMVHLSMAAEMCALKLAELRKQR